MIAATYTQGGRLEIVETPVPELHEGDVLLRVEAASICGTDTKIIRSGHRKLKDGQRITLGHEFAGIIEEVRGDAEGLKKGMRVGVAPNWGCGCCEACIRGLANYCPDYSAFGIESDGAHAEFVRVPAKAISQGNVVPLSDGLAWEEASLAEPLSCVVNAQSAVHIGPGDAVAVYGCGPMGLLHIILAAASGAGKVIALDINGERLESALKAGATHAVLSDRGNVAERIREISAGGVDVVITAVPVTAVILEGLDLLAPFGRLCLFAGLPKDKPEATINANAVHYKNLLVTGTTGGSNKDYRKALGLIQSRRVDVRQIISHRFSLRNMEQAYEIALAGKGMKIVLNREVHE
ncbi:MAG: alcohol dehydrogenase catalytic domain-containing protein [Verrucomicrobiae bacterium]